MSEEKFSTNHSHEAKGRRRSGACGIWVAIRVIVAIKVRLSPAPLWSGADVFPARVWPARPATVGRVSLLIARVRAGAVYCIKNVQQSDFAHDLREVGSVPVGVSKSSRVRASGSDRCCQNSIANHEGDEGEA